MRLIPCVNQTFIPSEEKVKKTPKKRRRLFTHFGSTAEREDTCVLSVQNGWLLLGCMTAANVDLICFNYGSRN